MRLERMKQRLGRKSYHHVEHIAASDVEKLLRFISDRCEEEGHTWKDGQCKWCEMKEPK